jgi:hypothetical protein
MGRFELVMALLSLFIRPVIANDSSAELATGGLVFTQNPAIEMRSEELFISLDQIKVRYVFFNNSNKDISSTVAFPMPDITISDPADDIAIPTDDPQNIVGFKTVVAGRTVSTQVEQRAFARGVDQSALLRRLGIPFAPHIEETHAARSSHWHCVQYVITIRGGGLPKVVMWFQSSKKTSPHIAT